MGLDEPAAEICADFAMNGASRE